MPGIPTQDFANTSVGKKHFIRKKGPNASNSNFSTDLGNNIPAEYLMKN